MMLSLHNRAIVRHRSAELPVVVPLVRTPLARATTTPARIAASEEGAAVLAARYGVTLDTIYRWRGRTSFEDRPHTAHQLATTLTPAQEAVAVELRRMLLLPLDDLLAVCRAFLNPDVSRSGLDPCVGKSIPRIVF